MLSVASPIPALAPEEPALPLESAAPEAAEPAPKTLPAQGRLALPATQK
jgi:hypothetical protein